MQGGSFSFPVQKRNGDAAGQELRFFLPILDSFSAQELWKEKRLEIMFSVYRPGSFTFASSFGCWCYAYYPGPCGGLC